MGQLVVGLAGAGLGFALGGPAGAQIGWMLGQFAWNLLDPPKIYGPRLNDTKAQGADYGHMVPIVYGIVRIGGIGMGQGSIVNGPNEFTEHEEKSSGKGGPEQINYRYTLSFANEICEGPILGVLRRWGNGRLITEAGATSDDTWPYTLYLGGTTQLPDPTLELIYGTGNVAPMRGRAYEVVEEVDVEDYGRARPNAEYEVYTVAGPFPTRVSTFSLAPDGAGIDCVTYAAGNVTIGSYTTSGGGHYYERTFTLQGVEDAGAAYDSALTASPITLFPVVNMLAAADFAGWFVREVFTTAFTANPGGGPIASSVSGIGPVYKNGAIFALGNNGLTGHVFVARWPATDGIISAETGTADAIYDFGNAISQVSYFMLGSSNNDMLYAVDTYNSPMTLNEFDHDLGLIRSWDITTEFGIQPIVNGRPFTVYENPSGELIFACDRGVGGSKELFCFYLNDDLTLTQIDGIGTDPAGGPAMGPIIELGSTGYVTVADGIASLIPPGAPAILGDIVADLLERAGLTSLQYDVTDLTQEVRGFVVASQMTVRNAIDILRKAYFFDITEYDGKLVCVNRGHDAIDTIPDADLAAHEPGSEPPEPLDVTRVPEAELPRTVFINYYDADNAYQTGSQYWRRTVTLSQSDVTLDLPIVLSVTEALQRAQWHMHFAWLERDRFTWQTTRKWAKLVPTDVVVVRGVNIRITKRTESPNGLIKFEGVRAFAGPYTVPITEPIDGEVPGSPASGQPPQNPPSAKAGTALVLLDGPLVSESESATAVRAAIYKDGTGVWPGGAVYKSIDGGTTYTSVASTSVPSAVGVVAAALGDFGGGNAPDEGNTISVVMRSGTLESTTADGLQNGLHLVALGAPDTGWEFLQYRTATLTAPDTYLLSGLLRGRFGTEWMMGEHATDETLILLASTVAVPGAFAEINASRKYKPVTHGTALADATAQDFTNAGVALKPFAPVLLGGGRDAGGDLTLTWTPRRRGSGGWPDGVDLPATESPEGYRVRVYTTSGYTTVARTITASSATAGYTAAEQTTDFGSPQATVYWDVAQLGSIGYGYAARGST